MVRLRAIRLTLGFLAFISSSLAEAQDWPQWRGPNRDAKVADFKAPDRWPEQLKQKWKIEVGDGVATPALVGGRLYTFSRQEGNEVVRCLEAATGKEVWQKKYAAAPVSGPARRFSGPRCSPTVADGNVLTLGVEGVLSCFDAKTGNLLWRHDEFKGDVPRFATASSPIAVDGLCIAQIGGGVMAYDLATGKEKWKWTGSGPAYGSPIVTAVGATKVIIAPTSDSMVALDVAGGSLLWQIDYSQGRYNAATPIVEGDTLIFAGPNRGMTAEKLALKEGKLTAKEIWRNTDHTVQFNTPVLKDGLLIGLSTTNSVFCIDAKTGATTSSAPLGESTSAGRASSQQEGGRERRGGRRRRGGGRGGYGSIVDTGSALLTLTPAGELMVYGPGKEKIERLASYRVAEGSTYAYPVVSGNRIFVKDGDSVTLWTTE